MDSAEEWSLVSSVKHSNRPITLVSSVGGFSRPAIEGIRTLHDLLRSIKPLKLQRYEGAQLQEARFLGEGVSYNVYKSTDVRSGLVVAVKKVKLPPAPASLTAFRSRIGCILKDIEVMSHLPLAQHPNILNILGYGWESQGEGLLPFIVTECATLGNLREYLTKSTTDAKRRRELCYQVASGLHGLHLSGVAHGDLKLENVLVTLAAADQVGPRRGPRREPVLAKLSDFGHSLRFASGTNLSQQTYHGTLWYNAPEVVQHNTTVADVRPRKCDAWALGLLCWEVHKSGARYYDDEFVREILSKTEPQSASLNGNSGGPCSLDQESARVLSQKLFNISSLVVEEAQSWVDRVLATDREWSRFDRILLKGVFKNTLQVDQSARTDNLSRLPLVHGKSELQKRSLLTAERAGEAQWTFTLFLEENISQIPLRVKVEMLEDFQRLASLPQGSSETSARAALHVVFAHAASFGTTALPSESAGFWIQKSVEGGLPIASLMKDVLEATLEKSKPPVKHEGPDGYNKALCLTIKTLARSEFPILSGIGPHSTFAALLNAVQSTGNQSLVAHYAVICQLTGILPARYVNVQSSKTGETALSLACRLGDYKAADDLLNLGAEPSICTADGCSALHWLFVFDKTHMEEMAIRLLYFGAVKRAADRPQLLDAQLPIDLHGTPLAFAVAAASMSAVEVLLDPQVSDFQVSRDPNSSIGGAYYQATSLHLYEILAKLDESCGYNSPFTNLGDLAKSSLVIKKLIHGRDLSAARDRTLECLLLSLISGSHTVDGLGNALETQIVLGLQSAVRAGDIPLAQKLIKSVPGITFDVDLPVDSHTVTTPKADGRVIQISEAPSQNERMNATHLNVGSAVSLSCAEVACSSIYDLETSLKILGFSIYYAPKLGYMDTWLVSMITAAQQYREDIFCWLLDNPKDFNARSSEGATIIHTMLRYNFTNLVPLHRILSKGADPDLPDEIDNTPIHVTLQLGMAQEFDTLLVYKASISLRDRDGNTPLHAAIKRGRLDAISRLLQHPQRKILINEKDSEGRSPLAFAALMGLPKVARLLLDAGADPGMLDRAQKAPIHLAALGSTSEHQLVLEFLLSVEPNVNILDREGNTALHLSITSQARLGNPTLDVWERLLAAGVDPQIRNNNGDLAIFLALQLLEKKLFSRFLPILLRYGADINARGRLSLSVLHIAALCGEVDLVQKLIQRGASPTLSGSFDHGTPMHCCAEGYFGRTTPGRMTFAAVSRMEATARCLIDGGADILARFSSLNRDVLEATPLDLALKTGPANIATILIQEHFSRLNESLGALHFVVLQEAFDYAVRYQYIGIVHQFLLSKLPINKSSLCDFGHGMKILANAIYNNESEILQCYKETQSQLVVSDDELPHLSSLKHITDTPSLWAIIRTSGSRVLEAEMYLRLYSAVAVGKTKTPKKEMITIGRDLERIVSVGYNPSSWVQEPLTKNFSSYHFPDGYWKAFSYQTLKKWAARRAEEGGLLVKFRYLNNDLEWLPDLIRKDEKETGLNLFTTSHKEVLYSQRHDGKKA